MRKRQLPLGNRNMIGVRVKEARERKGMKQKALMAQLQVNGVDMNSSGLSKIEGQTRSVLDFELAAIANILDVSVDWLLGRTQSTTSNVQSKKE
jgi:transcriptional regulator with XRE-family HTH domain